MSQEKKPSFRSMWVNPFPPIGQDLSDPFQDLIEEIPPFTKNEKGEWLNESSVPVYKKVGRINVQEQIQSFADEVDIYKILEKFAATGDESLLNKNPGFYYDISGIPTNFNDFQQFLMSNSSNLDLFSKEMKEKILNGDEIPQDLFEKEVKSIAKDKYNLDFDNPNVENKESESDK